MVVRIEDLPQHMGETVTLQGWLAGSRSSGKIAFLQLRDGSGFVQGVVAKNDVDEETFKLARSLTQESSVIVTGSVRADTRAKSGVELGLTGLEVVSHTLDYPITPKEHGVDFLFDHRHLHLRHRAPWARLRIRDEVQRGITDFFAERGFLRFDAPFFTPNAAEGTTNLFEINLFDEDTAYLSQSGQLYAEAGALAFGKVYTFGPTFRAEKSKTRKHLLEFWMLEPEVAYMQHEENMQLQEDLVRYLVARVLTERGLELELLNRDTRTLEATANRPFAKLTYDEALVKLAAHGEVLEWGEDLGAPHESILGDLYDTPVFVHSWPTKTKAFYMQPFDDDPTRVKCDDLIAPEGYGELIGGSERIFELELLASRIEAHHLPPEAFSWYLDLRRFGAVPHAGFGMGLERLVAWMTGAQHLRDVIPFPRMLTRMRP